ncbi:MAG: M28 family peptidase [Bacteroidales bacterium]|nr:M28 family peptidase [Bacteroidales bacterium]
MKKVIIIIAAMSSLLASAQQFIDNKGNRLQTYPAVTAVNPDVEALVEQVSMQNLENSIRWMQNLIRDAQSPDALATQNWLIEHFESFGLDVSVHYFPCYDFFSRCQTPGDTLDAGNVVAIQRGTEFPDEYIVVSSHYDHPGPGADDNASGTAGVVEIARILSQHSFKRSIMYVPFNAEELWMVGSLPFVEKCAQEDWNILGVFNLDMIGFFPESVGALTMSAGASEISSRLWEYYRTVANIYVADIPTFRFTLGDSYGGDHMPFNMYEYPALYIGDIEYKSLHPCYHRPCDTLGAGVNSLPLAQEFVRATLASVAELANGWLPPQNLSAVPDVSKVTISWDETPQTSVYKLFKNNVLLTETTATSYVDTDVVNGAEYTYYVKGIHSGSGEESAPSNTDAVVCTPSLPLPYYNDFQTNTDGFMLQNSDWVVRMEGSEGNLVLSNTDAGNESIGDNYLNMIEMNWFSVPGDIDNITLRLSAAYDLHGMWLNAACFLEVTTDRKQWHKLKRFSKTSSWKNYEVSLNEYIGAPFCQIRFRLESNGADDRIYKKVFKMDDVQIDFSGATGIQQPQQTYFKDLVISPNPTTGKVNISTSQNIPYQISVYNMLGQRIFRQDDFRDGNLDLSSFPKGAYMIRVTIDRHSVARKVVVK